MWRHKPLVLSFWTRQILSGKRSWKTTTKKWNIIFLLSNFFLFFAFRQAQTSSLLCDEQFCIRFCSILDGLNHCYWIHAVFVEEWRDFHQEGKSHSIVATWRSHFEGVIKSNLHRAVNLWKIRLAGNGTFFSQLEFCYLYLPSPFITFAILPS